MVANKLSPYSKTPIASTGYLDLLTVVSVPQSRTDILYEITPSYTHRPDLLAFDLYGRKELWWVFAQRNPDIIKDPVYDFVAGTKIYLPQGEKIRSTMGL